MKNLRQDKKFKGMLSSFMSLVLNFPFLVASWLIFESYIDVQYISKETEETIPFHLMQDPEFDHQLVLD